MWSANIENQAASSVMQVTLDGPENSIDQIWELIPTSEGNFNIPTWRSTNYGIPVGSSHVFGYIIKSPAQAEWVVLGAQCADGSAFSHTPAPTQPPTEAPTEAPTQAPTEAPTQAPTEAPTEAPTQAPTQAPTEAPTQAPTEAPTQAPTPPPTQAPTQPPTQAPTQPPIQAPTQAPTQPPTQAPTQPPTQAPTQPPTQAPTQPPTQAPTQPPTQAPTQPPTQAPTQPPTQAPTQPPTQAPTQPPTQAPTNPPQAGKCSGEPKMFNGKHCASTTRYYDAQMGACGCGTGNTSPFSWQFEKHTAAASGTIFGTPFWCGSGCGKCYKLTTTGHAMYNPPAAGQSIVVQVTNACPDEGNAPWCVSHGLNGHGYDAHFDLMDKNYAGLISQLGWDNPEVTYEEVPCDGSLNSPTDADYQTCQCAHL